MPQPSIRALFTEAQRRVVAGLLPTLAERLKLDQANDRIICFTPNELEAILAKARAAHPHAETGMTRNSLRHITDVVTQALADSTGLNAIPRSVRLFQFKITLLGVQPPIWRRIQVKSCTLDKLHEHIQTAMGWTNSHLHEFEISGERYGDPELMHGDFEIPDCVDSTVTKIDQVLPRDGSRYSFLYQYDFGDCWRHEVLFEGCLRATPGARYPWCVEGERTCPPEDVGGDWGYARFLEAIADPTHEEHDEFLEWAGEFDPEKFDPEQATKAMRRGLPDWRLYG